MDFLIGSSWQKRYYYYCDKTEIILLKRSILGGKLSNFLKLKFVPYFKLKFPLRGIFFAVVALDKQSDNQLEKVYSIKGQC